MFKKIILAALVVTSAVFAQNVKVGAHAAGSIGTAWGDNTDMLEIGWGAGFNVGAEAKVVINPSLAIVGGLGIDYRRIGWDIGGMMEKFMGPAIEYQGYSMSAKEKLLMDILYSTKATFSLLYIDIPVVARFSPAPKFFVDAGIDLGINVSASMTMEVESLGTESTEDIDSDMMSTLDFGLVAGLGYSITDQIDVNFRAVFGLTNMIDMKKASDKVSSDDEEDYSSEDDSDSPDFGFKNMRFHLGVTFWFI